MLARLADNDAMRNVIKYSEPSDDEQEFNKQVDETR
jgi:hypothetical protein